MNILINILTLLSAFVIMEGVAWFAHKYVMHGFLWVLHKDHHVREGKLFEKNDAFALIFAIPSWLFIMFGVMNGNDWKLYFGVGILVYGVVYVFIHEIFIHQRAHMLTHTNNTYLLALRRAHKVHHKKLTQEGAECFGMLVVPRRYFAEARKLKGQA